MSSYDAWLTAAATRRDAAGLQRHVQPRGASTRLIDLASNDYLGLATHPQVIAGAIEAVQLWGTGATGSRLVTGTTQAHVDLERALADFLDAPAGLVFATGYAANLGAITALGGPDALIVSDAHNHASIADACRLSRSRVVVTRHLDVAAVAAALRDRPEPRAMVVVDAVFSVDGVSAPLAELHAVCRANDALLLVDEAHSLGVIGPRGQGLAVDAGIGAAPDVVRTVTLSKSLGSQGGAVLASSAVIDHLVNTARTFIFDTGLAPGAVGAAAAALGILAAEPHLVSRLRERGAALASALSLPVSSAAVVPVVLGDPERTVRAAAACREAGVIVGCFRPPSVPEGESRLRLTARANLNDADLDTAVQTILDAVGART